MWVITANISTVRLGTHKSNLKYGHKRLMKNNKINIQTDVTVKQTNCPFDDNQKENQCYITDH